MSGGLPELGSKISLISKADIRYEGRLYTVDPQECTIALSSVRSFGTEDRETQFQIAPQSQIYDYILFRGSDIKDIRVVNNHTMPHHTDPAIMQAQLQNGPPQAMPPHFPMPNSMNAPQQQQQQQQQHGAPPSMGGAAPGAPGGGGYGNPFGLGAAGLASMTGNAGGASSLAPGAGAPGSVGPFMHMTGNQQQPKSQQQQQKQPISVLEMLAGASRSTTPISLISPTAELAPQQQMQQQQQNALGGGGGNGGNGRDAGHKRQNHQQGQQQQQRGGPNHMPQQRNNHSNDFYNHPQQQQQHQQQRDRRDSGRQMEQNYNNYNNQRNRGGGGGMQQRGGVGGGGGGGGGGGNNAWNMHRGGSQNPNNMMIRNRGMGGRGPMRSNQGFRPQSANQNKPRNKIKFEGDFDFEQANNKFEELRSQLTKLKVGDEPNNKTTTTTTTTSTTTTNTEQLNGETDKKDDSGNETGAGEHEPEDEDVHVGYDKTKSFFDNISCEAAQDRSKNKKNDWRQERKLNTETFGVSSTRRGGYRGRNHYYNTSNTMGGGGGNGGMNSGYGNAGYNRNNYRMGGGNYRNRSNNRNNNGGIGGGGNRGQNTVTNGNGNANSNTAAALKAANNASGATATNNTDSATTGNATSTKTATPMLPEQTQQVAAVAQ
ncbi:protein LSM14 homolog B-A isoform X2 [Scaptodrosophila lebanonensis]|uniref:Protein LSM14 homolog B-A isoform X2 n=1 Tax=Drosophila lebanonensis TaxID=7225 RepID=A0A6J2UD75_DROLE|nr:protein LSM14 homolog B-A isoform X2 [Scaptodrosophila lebanonensis]